MVTLRVILKSGQGFYVKCENCIILKDAYGGIDSIDIVGVVENDPVYLDSSQVTAIIRVMSDEPACVVLRGLDEAAPDAG